MALRGRGRTPDARRRHALARGVDAALSDDSGVDRDDDW
jgi:hypothetical protein